MAVTGANLVPDTTAVPQLIWDMVLPALTELKNKPDKNEQEKNALKLYRLLAEQPHIPLTDLQTIACPTLVIGGDHDVIKKSILCSSIRISQNHIYGFCPDQDIALL